MTPVTVTCRRRLKLLIGFFITALLVSHNSYAQTATCEYQITNEWGDGYTGAIRIINDSSSPVHGWNVRWQYQTNRVTNSWNVQLSGNNPYTASDMGWNGTIQPGQSVKFGFQVSKNGGSAERPDVTGAICSGTSSSANSSSSTSSSVSSNSSSATSSSLSSSSSSSPATSSLSSSSSSISSSSTPSTGQETQCNWYGTLYPLCEQQNSDWGWENSASCIGESTCSGQPAPYGVVNGTSSSSESSSSSSVSSSSSSSSSSVSSSSSSNSSSSSGYEPIVGGCSGYATRFWDCCKPHCAWTGNLPNSVEPMQTCSINDQPLAAPDAGSSCEGGNAYTCHNLAPYAVNENLSFGYAATSSGDVCGRCFQLEFTGESYNAPGDPGSAALAGKTMVVQAINIGHDVGGGQFDIMVPGGGVGAFNGCSTQWGVSNEELGAQYGGFLSACKQELGYNASHDAYKSCVTNRCDAVFGSRGLTELQEGCLWYAEWFEAADNPALRFKEVACPTELAGTSGMDRSPLGDISGSCN